MNRAELSAATAGAAALLAVTVATGSTTLVAARLVILGAALGAVTRSDLREHRIPNRVVVPATVASGGLLLADHVDLAALLPALAVVAAFLVVSLIVPAALGMGDVKLALLLVFGLGGDATAAITGGFALASLYALLLIARHGAAARRTALPLAPFLAAGALLTAALA